MKRVYTLLLSTIVATSNLWAQPATPFEKGVNLSNWFQGSTVQDVDFLRYTYDDFIDIQSLGVDVIRLPINFHGMSSGAPDYTLDPILLDFLDNIVNWTEELGLHLILDNHSFDDGGPTTPAVNTPLSRVWPQLTEHFIDRDSTLYFELKNEPWDISDFIWDTVQQNIVNIIREIDTSRTLIVGPAGWNSYNNLDAMMNYTDDNLIYTFHFYDPFIFTHQGASWTSPSMEPLTGVPFPYGASAMPACPSSLAGTWIQSNMASYSSHGTITHMYSLLDIATTFRASRNVPIYCGEFGVLNHNSDPDHRVEWYRATTHYLDSLDIGWTMWDYHGGFGLFERYSDGRFDHDLNIPLIEAMGLNPPPQTNYIRQPDSVGFYIYDDFIAQAVSSDFNIDGEVMRYDTEDPRVGNYNLNWVGGNQYDRMTFDFTPDKDLSRLLDDEFVLTFWANGTGTPLEIDIRFLDSKTDVPEDHPWRMSKSLLATGFEWNGTWQYIQIPLTSMAETGSWDGFWFDPVGLFEWADIDRFELALESAGFGSNELSLDEIRIVDQRTASLNESRQLAQSFTLAQNFPNPFNPSTSIQYSLAESDFIRLTIYDVNGRVVETLVSERLNAGSHTISWNPGDRNLGTGVYFARLDGERHSRVNKMLFLK